jgi:hypothetical protein
MAVQAGFFSWVDGAPAEGYRSVRSPTPTPSRSRYEITSETDVIPYRERDGGASVGVLTGEYGARVLGPLLEKLGRDDVRLIPVRNEFFGGNIAVTGLLTGADLARALADEPLDHRYLLPDVCLSNGVFLDGTTPADLPRPVEVVATDGVSLRRALLA